MELVLKIDGVQIESPSSFRIERYKITNSERLANGDMSMELIAKKKKFILKYDIITLTELNKILDLIDGDNMFFTFQYTENGITKAATVYSGDIPSDLLVTGNEWYYKDIGLDLIEK